MTPQPGPADEAAAKLPTGPSTDQVGEGISAFLGRVFDQLSVTSWLPAVFFVGNASILLALQGQNQLVLTDAIQALVKLEWGALVVLLFAVIIAAMVIQAFDFENLRFWEGYWRSRPLKSWSDRRIRTFQRRLRTLEDEFRDQERAAFADARQRALDDKATTTSQRHMWNAMEKVIHRRDLDEGDGPIADRAAVELDWPSHGDPVKLHTWDITKLKLREFPQAHRVLPTRLGNVMRAAEDQVVLGLDEDLEGFMIRHMDQLPKTIVVEHAAYRRRLEMYCGLMFVLGLLALISVFCFWGSTTDLAWRVIVPALYVAGVWVSYKAAIASALGFGQALKEATSWLQKSALTLTSPAPSS